MRELDLLRYIYARNPRLPESVTIPPGDDMAGVQLGGGLALVTVDPLAAGVHVDPDHTPIELIGRKALTRNLSDVTAPAG
jgi:thiamine monophosphate kinase